jgi:cell shape-determining protein MreC
MKRNDFLRFGLFLGLVFVILYLVNNRLDIITEHLTEEPPSLESLREENKALKEQIEKVKSDLNEMKTKSEAGAAQAQGAMLQLQAAKTT